MEEYCQLSSTAGRQTWSRTKNEIATVRVYNPARMPLIRRSGRPGGAVNRGLYIVGVPTGDGSRLAPRFGRLIRPRVGYPFSVGSGAYPSLMVRRSVCLMYRSRRAYAMLMRVMARHDSIIWSGEWMCHAGKTTHVSAIWEFQSICGWVKGWVRAVGLTRYERGLTAHWEEPEPCFIPP